MKASVCKKLKNSSILIAICFAMQMQTSILISPAQAYYYPLGYGNFVPGLLSTLPYFGSSFLNRAPYSSYPLFTLQNSLYRASTRTLASPYNYNYIGNQLQDPSNYPYQAETYYDPEPWYQPRQRTRPARMGGYGVDQNAHATWQSAAPQNYSGQPPTVPPTSPGYFNDPLRSNNPNQYTGPFTPPGEMPPLAPQVVTKRDKSLSSLSSLSPSSTANAGPLAQGFVAKVNQAYDGDIARALFDPEMRGWARCLDLVKDDDLIKLDLSPARVGLIQQVLKDDTLDDLSKLDAVKVLLRGGANRANQ